jgi:NADPH:quinone reductase-like Zn-dependent oxidoreductase
VDVALDCIGTDEALAVSLALVPDPGRMVSIVASAAQAEAGGFRMIGGAMPESKAYRDSIRAELIDLAGEGRLEVTVAATYPLEQALVAAEALEGRHPGGKLALLP